MTPIDIMLQVIDLDPSERDRRIASLCGGDAELEAEVRQLLEIDASESSFLETPAAADAYRDDTDRPPATIGPYELGEMIGQGGFGAVYRATQRVPVRREVAIKLIRRGMGTPAVLRRFELERQQLASLEHPNIARFIDAGVTGDGEAGVVSGGGGGGDGGGGIPYFVLELVEGDTIAAHARSARLGLSATVRIFLQACEAVKHAHARGLIHRDIKPGNVLVADEGGEAVCKVIDFGIAKAVHDQSSGADTLTLQGVPIGTPQYMSPEQARGDRDIDTRADVYALGALLYELVVGVPPFDELTSRGSNPSVLLRGIEESELGRPSARLAQSPHGRFLPGALRGEIDWIIAKAMEKSRERRYGSVVELAQDLEASLGGLPVTARPPSSLYRAGKFVSRHRASVAAAAVAVVGITGGAAAAVAFGIAAESAREREESQRRIAELSSARAEGINDFLLRDLFYAADTSELGPEATLIELVDRAAPSVEDRFGEDPEMLVRVHMMLGDMRHRLMRSEQAVQDYTRAAERLDEVPGLDPGYAASVFSGRAHARHAQGDHAGAERDLDRALAVSFPAGEPEWSSEPALAALKAMLLRDRREFEEADRYFRISIDAYAANPESKAKELTRVMSQRLAMLGTMRRDEDLVAQADEMLALESRLEGRAALVNRHLALFWKSQALLRLGRESEAADTLEALIEPVAEINGVGSYPHATFMFTAGSTMCRAGRVERGLELMLEAIPLLENVFGPHDYQLEKATGTVANRLDELGRHDEAQPWRVRQKLLRLYVAGPGETESVREVSRESAEMFGADAWRDAVLDESEALPADHPKRSRLLAHAVVAMTISEMEGSLDPQILRAMCLDGVGAIGNAAAPGDTAIILSREIMPIIRRLCGQGEADDAEAIIAPFMPEP